MKKAIVLTLFVGALALYVLASEAADLNIYNPSYPVTPAGNIGWDPGMTHARAIHWAYDGRPNPPENQGWYQYWGSCPDDPTCANSFVTSDHYHADFDMFSWQTPCHPNTGDAVNIPANQPGMDHYNGLPCPLYLNWWGYFGNSSPKSFSVGINNYSWNYSNSLNMWVGLKEDKYRSSTLAVDPPFDYRRLDNALLSLTLDALLSRDYVQNGITARGQGRIHIGFTFEGGNGITYVVEMNLSNMRKNLNDHRHTVDEPWGATQVPVSNPWRDDIWGEYIIPATGVHPRMAGTHTYVVGARNWGFNLVEGQSTTILFDPWWVATTLVWPPDDCPTMVDANGNPTGSYNDPSGYGIVPCGGNKGTYAMPVEALFDSNWNCTAKFIGFYVGIEMAGSAVYGDANIANWTIKERW